MAKYFLRSSIDHFNVGKDQSHVALMTFGGTREGKVVFDFNSNQQWERSLKPQIDSLAQSAGRGQVLDILKLACDNIFCAAGGTRDNVPKVGKPFIC